MPYKIIHGKVIHYKLNVEDEVDEFDVRVQKKVKHKKEGDDKNAVQNQGQESAAQEKRMESETNG